MNKIADAKANRVSPIPTNKTTSTLEGHLPATTLSSLVQHLPENETETGMRAETDRIVPALQPGTSRKSLDPAVAALDMPIWVMMMAMRLQAAGDRSLRLEVDKIGLRPAHRQPVAALRLHRVPVSPPRGAAQCPRPARKALLGGKILSFKPVLALP